MLRLKCCTISTRNWYLRLVHKWAWLSGSLPGAHDSEYRLYDCDSKNEDFFHIFMESSSTVMENAINIGLEEAHSFSYVEIQFVADAKDHNDARNHNIRFNIWKNLFSKIYDLFFKWIAHFHLFDQFALRSFGFNLLTGHSANRNLGTKLFFLWDRWKVWSRQWRRRSSNIWSHAGQSSTNLRLTSSNYVSLSHRCSFVPYKFIQLCKNVTLNNCDCVLLDPIKTFHVRWQRQRQKGQILIRRKVVMELVQRLLTYESLMVRKETFDLQKLRRQLRTCLLPHVATWQICLQIFV